MSTYNTQGYASPGLTVTSTDDYRLVEVKGSGSFAPGRPSSHSNLVYCHVVAVDKTANIWSCAPTAASAVGGGPDSYRTQDPPEGCLKV